MQKKQQNLQFARGFTIVELMVGIAVGLFIVAGLALLFANTSFSRNEMEKSSRMIENGRYAAELLRDEIQMAGYYDILALPSGATQTLAATCDTGTVGFGTSPTTVPVPLRGFDAWPADCSPTTYGANYRTGTDALVIRRVSSTAISRDAVVSSSKYLQASACGKDAAATPFIVAGGSSGNFTLHNKKPNSATECNVATNFRPVRALISRVFFIANCNVCSEDQTPTLKMLDLQGSTLVETALVEGVENMQMEYRVDTNSDGVADLLGQTATQVDAANNWPNVVAVDVYLLARNNDATPSYSDDKDYKLGATTDNAAARSTADKKYKRHVFSISVRASNTAIQREKP